MINDGELEDALAKVESVLEDAPNFAGAYFMQGLVYKNMEDLDQAIVAYGQAISLVCVDEHKLLKDIERLLKMDIRKEVVSGYEVDPRIKAEPITQGRRQHQAPKKGGTRRSRT